MTIINIISNKKINKFYNLQELGVFDYAFPYCEAIEIIRYLKDEFYYILGGDVFKINGGKFSYADDSWYCERKKGETASEYLNRCYKTALEFIQTRKEIKNYVYSITFSEDILTDTLYSNTSC